MLNACICISCSCLERKLRCGSNTEKWDERQDTDVLKDAETAVLWHTDGLLVSWNQKRQGSKERSVLASYASSGMSSAATMLIFCWMCATVSVSLCLSVHSQVCICPAEGVFVFTPYQQTIWAQSEYIRGNEVMRGFMSSKTVFSAPYGMNRIKCNTIAISVGILNEGYGQKVHF